MLAWSGSRPGNERKGSSQLLPGRIAFDSKDPASQESENATHACWSIKMACSWRTAASCSCSAVLLVCNLLCNMDYQDERQEQDPAWLDTRRHTSCLRASSSCTESAIASLRCKTSCRHYSTDCGGKRCSSQTIVQASESDMSDMSDVCQTCVHVCNTS